MEKFDRLAKRVGNFLECFAEISMAVFFCRTVAVG